MDVVVLRLTHRPARDKRITMHICLVARAFGANGVVYTGTRDVSLEENIRKVVRTWGGPFFVRYESSWKKVVREWKGKIVHLTMYGLNVDDVIDKIKKDVKGKDLLVIVGSEKVPGKVYKLADFNVAIGNQPHSEVSALAIFLDRLFGGKELKREFKDAKLKILPQKEGKKVIQLSNRTTPLGSNSSLIS